MGFEEILTTLKELLSHFGLRKERRTDRATNEVALPEFRGWQAPFRTQLKSSGGFDPTGKGSVGRPHQGLDLRAPIGQEMYPIAPGVVKYVRPDPKGGNTCVIDHMNGYTSYYAHCSVILVHPGDRVGYDTVIAKNGASGNAKGFGHLHIQVWRNGSLIDPASVIPGVPPYTPFDSKTEKLALPGAKEEAAAWSMEKHLQSKKV